MAKYIDAEKLIAEIQRRNLSNYHIDTYDYETELYEIIDSLQQEQPKVDLEEEIEKELRLHYNDDQDVYWWNYLKNSFHHFYELGKNSE